MELNTILRPSTQSQVNQPPRASPTSVPPVPPLPTLPPTVLEPSSHTLKKELTCNNCKSQGLRFTSHTVTLLLDVPVRYYFYCYFYI